MSDAFAKRTFIVSAIFLTVTLAFGWGVAAQQYRIWPYPLIDAAVEATQSLVRYGRILPDGRRVTPPPGAARQFMTIHDAARINRGFYAFVGWDGALDSYAAWLYDSHGTRLHTWPIDYTALDPDGSANGVGNPHSFHVMPDGSIIVSFDRGEAMARLDACSKPMWIKSGIYHHQMSRADDGTFWVWRGDGTAYGHVNDIVNFDAETGATIREISLLDDIIDKLGPSAVVFGVRPDFPFRRFERDPPDREKDDLFHPNDVDVLPASLAAAFPEFEAGDLLLSFRTISLVAVLDPDDHRLKWWARGPWLKQHDPDFTADGRISVYDNNSRRERSEIIKIDPVTRQVSNDLFAGSAKFYSRLMGTHQYLPNGNVLIVVPGEGRIISVSRHGDYVMEFNNLSADAPDQNEHVQNGMWVPLSYFSAVPACHR